MNQRILFIGDTDSQLLYCQALARFSAYPDVDCCFNVVPREGTPQQVIERLRATGSVQSMPINQLIEDRHLDGYTGIGVFLTGSGIAEFRNRYSLHCQARGVNRVPLFCGFNGVVLEKFEEGLSWRLGYDVICLNGPSDYRRAANLLLHTPWSSQVFAITGVSRSGYSAFSSADLESRPKQVVFAEQVLIPRSESERERLVFLLAGLARRSPEWQVLIRPRVSVGDRTFHRSKEHISFTVGRLLGSTIPANLHIVYDPLPQLLQSSRVLLTVSSTAFFDALDHGCRPFVVTDFGLSQRQGTLFFAGSGALLELAQTPDLDRLDLQAGLHEDWLEQVGYHHQFSPDALIRSLALSDPRQPIVGFEEFVTATRSPHGVVRVVPEPSSIRLRTREVARSSSADKSRDLTAVQLRRAAENCIKRKDWHGAERLLQLAMLQKPSNRNIARRLQAVSTSNRLLRRLLLMFSHRFR